MNYQLTCNYLLKKYKISEKTSYKILKKLNTNRMIINKISKYYNYKDVILNKEIDIIKMLLKKLNI